MSRRIDREIELLERELNDTDDPKERREIIRSIYDLERDEAERERWEDEGHDRGWI